MYKARNIWLVLAATAAIMACGIGGLGSAPTAPGDTVATAVAATIQALTPTVAPQATASQGIPVNYKNVSLVIPMGLATDAVPQTVGETTDQNGGPWGVAPEHIEFRLENCYVAVKPFNVCQIDVYPAEAYANQNTGANISLQRLKGLLGDPSASLTNQTLPQVPYFNAASMFAAQVQRIHFASGDGVRMVTQYAQGIVPVSNDQTFFHFEGLTSDGNYYIVAVLPVQAPFLQNSSDPNTGAPSGGVPFPSLNSLSAPTAYENYVGAVSEKLDSYPADQFSPALATLDALIRSLKVSP